MGSVSVGSVEAPRMANDGSVPKDAIGRRDATAQRMPLPRCVL